MGGGYTVFSCSSCGFGSGFYVGVSKSIKTLKDALVKVHPKRRLKVFELLDDHTVHDADFEHRIYLCQHCGDVRNPFWVKIVFDDDSIYETEFKCVRCHNAMVNVTDQIKQSKACPCCGSDKMSYAEGLLWD